MAAPLTPRERPTNIRYWVLGSFCAAAAIAYVQRYAINLLAPDIGRDLDLDKSEMGSVMASFFTAYAIASIPSGYLGDRFGPRKTLTIFAVVWSLAMILMARAWDQTSMTAAWAVAGVAQAGIFPCAMIALRDWLPSTRRGVGSGMLSTFMNVGAVLSPHAAATLRDGFGLSWRATFALLSIPGLAWAAFHARWFRNRPSEHRAVNESELLLIAEKSEVAQCITTAREPTPWLTLLGSFRMWLICAQQFLRAAAQVFFGTWFVTFLQETPDIPSAHVPTLASIPPLLLIAGSFAGGIVSDWLLFRTGSRRISRQGLAVGSLWICAGMFLAAMLSENGYTRVALISIGCFFMTTGGVSSYAITMDVGGRHVATVFSTMNMCGSLGAASFPKYAGWLVEKTGDWNSVLGSIALIYVGAAICWALLNPTGTLFDEKKSALTTSNNT